MSKNNVSQEIISAYSELTNEFFGDKTIYVNNKTIFVDDGNGVLVEVYKHNNESFRVETYSSGKHKGNQFCQFRDIVATVRDAISFTEKQPGIINSHVGSSSSVYIYSDLNDHYGKNVLLFHGIVKFSRNGTIFIISPLDDKHTMKDVFTLEAFDYSGLIFSERVKKEEVLPKIVGIVGPYAPKAYNKTPCVSEGSVEGLTGVRIQHLVKGETVDEIFVGSKNKQVQFKHISDQLIKEFF